MNSSDTVQTPAPAAPVPAPRAPQPEPALEPEPDRNRDRADIDMDRLSGITETRGFAVFDPAAAGGVRELSTAERALLEREMAREPQPGLSGDQQAGARVDDAARRGATPGFPYLPGAEWGSPGYREPRTDAEAAARAAYLDTQRRPAEPDEPDAQPRPSEIEQALVDAEIDAHYSALARDGDPGPARRVADLEALQALRPTPEHHQHQHGQHQHDQHQHDQHQHDGPALDDLDELDRDDDELEW